MMTDLSPLTILVTRPNPAGLALCELIKASGGQAIHFPTIAFAPAPDQGALQRAIKQLGEQDWLIFISPQAVYESVVAIRREWPELPPNVKFAAVGEGTAKALQAAGYNVAVVPAREWSSEGLLNLPEFQSVSGAKIAIIRGVAGREWLDRVLAERGAVVTPVIAYERVLPQVEVDTILAALTAGQINVIVCTSFEGVKNLKQLLGKTGWPYLKAIPTVVMSERIKILAQDLDFQTIWVAQNAGNQAILDVLAKNRDNLCQIK